MPANPRSERRSNIFEDGGRKFHDVAGAGTAQPATDVLYLPITAQRSLEKHGCTAMLFIALDGTFPLRVTGGLCSLHIAVPACDDAGGATARSRQRLGNRHLGVHCRRGGCALSLWWVCMVVVVFCAPAKSLDHAR